MTIMRFGVCAGLLHVALTLTTPAQSEEHVALTPSSCATPPFDDARVQTLLALELAGAGVILDPEAGQAVSITPDPCDADATAVEIRFRGKRVSERRVLLADIPLAARPRAIALAANELIVSALTPPPTPSPPSNESRTDVVPVLIPMAGETKPAFTPTVAPIPRMRDFSVGLSMASRVFPVNETWPIGIDLRASIRLYEMLRLRTAISGFFAQRQYEPAIVNLGNAAGAVGLSLGARGDVVGFDVGPRLDLGIGVIDARKARENVQLFDDVVGLTSTIGLDLEIDLYPSRGFAATLGIEGGAALAGVSATSDDRVLLGTNGPFIGLRLGAAILP